MDRRIYRSDHLINGGSVEHHSVYSGFQKLGTRIIEIAYMSCGRGVLHPCVMNSFLWFYWEITGG